MTTAIDNLLTVPFQPAPIALHRVRVPAAVACEYPSASFTWSTFASPLCNPAHVFDFDEGGFIPDRLVIFTQSGYQGRSVLHVLAAHLNSQNLCVPAELLVGPRRFVLHVINTLVMLGMPDMRGLLIRHQVLIAAHLVFDLPGRNPSPPAPPVYGRLCLN